MMWVCTMVVHTYVSTITRLERGFLFASPKNATGGSRQHDDLSMGPHINVGLPVRIQRRKSWSLLLLQQHGIAAQASLKISVLCVVTNHPRIELRNIDYIRHCVIIYSTVCHSSHRLAPCTVGSLKKIHILSSAKIIFH